MGWLLGIAVAVGAGAFVWRRFATGEWAASSVEEVPEDSAYLDEDDDFDDADVGDVDDDDEED